MRTLIAEALPVTIELAILATVLGALVGVAIGVFAASHVNRVGDVAGQGFGLLGLGIPNFIVGSTIIAVLATNFAYFPSAARYVGFFESPLENLQQQFWPAVTLAVGLAAAVMRTTRSAFLEANSQDFVRTAKGKGLTPRRIRWRHVLHNSSIPIVTIVGIQFGYLLGGTVIVEEIFALPGWAGSSSPASPSASTPSSRAACSSSPRCSSSSTSPSTCIYVRIDPRVKLT